MSMTPEEMRGFLSKSAQQKLDAALRAHKKRLDDEFEQRVQVEASKRLDELILPHYNAKLDEAERVIKARKGAMSRAEYRQYLAALHPDNVDEGRKFRWGELFNGFKNLESLLVAEAELPTPETERRRTWAETMKNAKRKVR